jgi:hypothetical protein
MTTAAVDARGALPMHLREHEHSSYPAVWGSECRGRLVPAPCWSQLNLPFRFVDGDPAGNLAMAIGWADLTR